MSVTTDNYDEVVVGRRRLLEQFSSAWADGDVETLMSLMTDDAEFRSSVGPEPGRIFKGAAEVERGFRLFLSPGPSNSTSTSRGDLIGPDFAVTRWLIRTVGPDGEVTEVLGCDVFEFEGERIRLKDAYRKVLAPS